MYHFQERYTFTIRKTRGLENVRTDDYQPVDPSPSSKATIRPGPIEHGAPLLPYVPRYPPPPPPASCWIPFQAFTWIHLVVVKICCHAFIKVITSVTIYVSNICVLLLPYCLSVLHALLCSAKWWRYGGVFWFSTANELSAQILSRWFDYEYLLFSFNAILFVEGTPIFFVEGSRDTSVHRNPRRTGVSVRHSPCISI